MTDYNGYVHCGEVFRSPIPSNEKPYLFKCIQCQDVFQPEAFLAHFEQNLCELREITIKAEVIDNGCLGGRSEKGKNEGINSNSIDEIDVNQDSLVFIKDDDVCNADEKDHIRSKIESSDAEVDPEQQEFETDVSLDDDLDLDDDKYDSEDSNVTDETEYLVKRKQGKEEETMCSREFVSNYIENHDNVMALIEAYKSQTPLWSKRIRDKEQRQKYLEIVTKELNQKQNLHLHWKQVSTLIRHLRRNYEDDLKQYKDSQQQKTTYRSLWFSMHMQFLEPFIENNDLATLDPHLPSLLQEQIVQILKIYENLPHLWNTSLLEQRCKNKRCESEMEMIKRIEATLGYKIDCEALNKYLKKIHRYFVQEKLRTQNDGHLQNSGLYQHLVFLLDHVGPFRCSQCDFENRSIFKYKVHLSQHDGSMPFKCSQCGKEFKRLLPYDIHVRRHLKDFQDICQECGKMCLFASHLRTHMRTHTKAKPFSCEICGMCYRYKQSLRSHESSHTNNYLHSCKLCSKGFYVKAKLTDHLKSHTNVRDYVCKTCGKAFKTTSDLRKHENTHSDVRKYVCKTCGKAFKTTSDLRQHEITHGDVRKCVCKTCGKAFKTTTNLRKHEITHGDVRKCVCKTCGKAFKTGSDLRKHEITHGDVRNCVCKTCGKAYKTTPLLRSHENTHSDVRKYVCKTCGKAFKTTTTLRSHENTHGDVRKCVCKTCGKAFKTGSDLRKHEITHGDVRNCVCKTCGKAYKTTPLLRSHENTHSDVRKYVCKTCGKAFKTTTTLRSHENTHSDVKKYVCTICSKSFKAGRYLTQHMRLQHEKN